jgi:hypothetical protein
VLSPVSSPLNGNLPISYPPQTVSFSDTSKPSETIGSLRFAPVTGVTYLLQQFQAFQQVQETIQPTYDIYVSSRNGDDNKDGLSPKTAVLTIARAIALLGNDKSLGLEYGSYFREMLSIKGYKNVRVGAYSQTEIVPYTDSKAFPILDASREVKRADINPTPGAANVYQFSETTSYDPTGRTYPFSTFQDGKRLKRVNDLPTCTSTEGSFWFDTVNKLVCFHPILNVDPRNPPVVIEVAVRDAGVDVDNASTGLRISRIHAKRSILNDGAMRLNGKGAVATDCIAEDGTKHTLYVTDGCLLENVVCWKGEGLDSYFVYYYDNTGLTPPDVAGDSIGTTFRRCAAIGGFAFGAEKEAEAGIGNSPYYTSSGFYCHSDDLPSVQLSSVTYEGCYAENLGSGFGGEAQLMNIRNCSTYKVATGASGASYIGQVANIENNTFDQRDGAFYQKAKNENRTLLNVVGKEYIRGRRDTSYAGGTTNIENNTLLIALPDGEYGFFLYSNNPGNASLAINFRNNTFFSATNRGNGLSKHGAGLLTFTHNAFYNVAQILYYTDINAQVISSDNVYYHQGSQPTWQLGTGNPYSFINWKKQLVPTSNPAVKVYQDARSTLADPLFITTP